VRDSSTQIRTTQPGQAEIFRSALQEEMVNFIQQSRISEINRSITNNSLKDSEKISSCERHQLESIFV